RLLKCRDDLTMTAIISHEFKECHDFFDRYINLLPIRRNVLNPSAIPFTITPVFRDPVKSIWTPTSSGESPLLHFFSGRLSEKEIITSRTRSEEHTSELQSRENLVCRLLLEKK